MSAFRWQGRPVFRDTPANNRNVLEASNYPLVPYSNRIPCRCQPLTTMPDWFTDQLIDGGFTGRKGDIHIDWPTHRLTMRPDDDLSHTVIYCPPGRDFFCVEPVTHMIDAANRSGADVMRIISPGETWAVKTRFIVSGKS